MKRIDFNIKDTKHVPEMFGISTERGKQILDIFSKKYNGAKKLPPLHEMMRDAFAVGQTLEEQMFAMFQQSANYGLSKSLQSLPSFLARGIHEMVQESAIAPENRKHFIKPKEDNNDTK